MGTHGGAGAHYAGPGLRSLAYLVRHVRCILAQLALPTHQWLEI